MADVTIKVRTGSWVVELLRPLHYNGRTINDIEIKPPRLEHQIRFLKHEIPSTMALMAELSGLPERLLRDMTSPDSDMVMLALYNVMPPPMKTEFETGNIPLASPDLDMEFDEGVPDQDDPRFQRTDEPVKKFVRPPVINYPDEVSKRPNPAQEMHDPGDTGLATEPPEMMKAVI